MTTLHITVAGKTATYLRRDGAIVCGNDDYRVAFTFDEEWAGYEDKMARFIWAGKHYDEPIANNEAAVPPIDGANEVVVGLYVDGQLRTTTKAVIPCLPSVMSGGEPAHPSYGEGYADEAKRAAEAAADSAASAAENADEASAAQTAAQTAAEEAQDSASAASASAAVAQEAEAVAEVVLGLDLFSANLFNGGETRQEDVFPYGISITPTSLSADCTGGGQPTTLTTFARFCPRAMVGKEYTIAYDRLGTSSLSCAGVSLDPGTKFTLTESMAASGITLHAGYTEAEGMILLCNVFNIMVNEGDARPYEKDYGNPNRAIAELYTELGEKVNASEVSAAAKGGAIVRRQGNANVTVPPTPKADTDAASKGYVDTGLATKAEAVDVEKLRKRVVNLERGVTPDPYHVDDAVAYVKAVPANALPYAQIDAVGGMTHKVAGAELPLGPSYFLFADEGNNGAVTDETIQEMFPGAEVGKTYTIVYDAGEEGGSLNPVDADLYELGNPFTLIEGARLACYAYASNGNMHTSFGNVRLIGEGVLRDTKVTALISANAAGTELGRIAIPAEVQALDGYGWGISAELHNGIEWDENGKATFVKRVARVTFDGTETWGGGNTINGFYVSTPLIGAKVIEGQIIAMLCNKFVYGMPDVIGAPCAYSTAGRIAVFPGTLATTPDEWKAKLAEWAAAGDPLVAYYPLATPVVTDVSHLVSVDNLIEVEPGGTITVQNENGDAAPSTVVYQLKPTEA